MLDGQNIVQMKHSEAYDSMMLKHITHRNQPTRRRLCTHETHSTIMCFDQLNGVQQAEREHLVKRNKRLYQKQQILIIS